MTTKTFTTYAGADMVTNLGHPIGGITWTDGMQRGSIIFDKDVDAFPENLEIYVYYWGDCGMRHYLSLYGVQIDSPAVKAQSVHTFKFKEMREVT